MKNQLINKILKVVTYEELPKTFLIFYSVGLLLFLLPLTRELFTALTPISLLLVNVALLYHHRHWNFRFTVFVITVVASSFFIEAEGVRGGVLFGDYQYLDTLGPKVLKTPLIIGLNWLMLTYCSAAIMEYIRRRSAGTVDIAVKIIGGALLMVTYDIVVEMVAPGMGMWEFSQGYPPARNFVMWFVMAMTYHILFTTLKIKPVGKPAIALFASQIAFFLIISLFTATGII
jgi:putative membrane protein